MDVTYSVLAAPALEAEIEKAYDIDPPLLCRLHRRAMSDTYLLISRTDRFVVRVYRASHSASTVAFELDLRAHIAGKGVPVSMAIAAKDGRLAWPLPAPEGLRHLVLFPCRYRRPFESTDPEQWRAAGRLLARVHAAADDFEGSCPHGSLDLAASVDRPLTVTRPLFAERPADLAYVEGLAARLRSRLEAMAHDGLDWGICHGGFNARAMHVAPDRSLVLDDFDDCAAGWRAWDLAGVFWAGRRARWVDARSDQGGAAIWNNFTEGYTATRSLQPRDLEAASMFVVIRHLWSLAVFLEKADEWGIRHVTAEGLDRWIEFLHDCAVELERAR
jgi:Ser/Thr protein kinase RdoA (MazF antagonist)